MWLFTNFGFFSIVTKSGGDELTIRSRTRSDLLRLKRSYLSELSVPAKERGTDYPWRSMCSSEAFQYAMPKIVEHISYSNFKSEIGQTLGTPRASRYGKIWTALYDMPEDCPEPDPRGWSALPWPETTSKSVAYGGIVIDRSGRILLREVANHYDGYVWTFAKGRPDAGESPRDTAVREVEEETGVKPDIVFPLHGTFAGGTTSNRYFIMLAESDPSHGSFRCAETCNVRWAPPSEARKLIGLTTNQPGRERDFAVLEAALALLVPSESSSIQVARAQDWTRRPMPANRRTIETDLTFGPPEIRGLLRGLVPREMEEKWFVYLEDSVVHIHRSWTGFEVLRLHLTPTIGEQCLWRSGSLEINSHPEQCTMDDDEALEVTRNLLRTMQESA